VRGFVRWWRAFWWPDIYVSAAWLASERRTSATKGLEGIGWNWAALKGRR